MEKGFNLEEAKKCLDLYLEMQEGSRGLWKVTEDLGIFGTKKEFGDFTIVVERDEDYNYYVLIRGTDLTKPIDLFVDVEVFIKREFPFPVDSDLKPSVSGGIKSEFMTLVTETRNFLNNLPDGTNLYIVGHSQGAAACGIFYLWLETFIPEKFQTKVYAFAPPSIGNDDFATLIDQYTEYGYYRIINPKDLVPYAYANVIEGIDNNIPVKIPLLLKGVYHLIYFALTLTKRQFAQVGTTVTLQSLPLENCKNSFWQRIAYYACEVANQHEAVHYRELLNEPYTINEVSQDTNSNSNE